MAFNQPLHHSALTTEGHEEITLCMSLLLLLLADLGLGHPHGANPGAVGRLKAKETRDGAQRSEHGGSGRDRGGNLLAVIFPQIPVWPELLVLIRRLPLQKRIVP